VCESSLLNRRMTHQRAELGRAFYRLPMIDLNRSLNARLDPISIDAPHPPQTHLWLLSCLALLSKPHRINGEVYGELCGRGGSEVGWEQLARDQCSQQLNQVLTSVGNSPEIKEQFSILPRPLG
jgi:hypothetical protein